MTTIENLKELETELTALAKSYSGTMAASMLYEEQEHITKVLRFLQEKRNGLSLYIIIISLRITLNVFLIENFKASTIIGLALRI